MLEVESYSWWFVNEKWARMVRMPIPDEGFEKAFRENLYDAINFDVVSTERDMKLGLSYTTLSENPHELDVICFKGYSESSEYYKFIARRNLASACVFKRILNNLPSARVRCNKTFQIEFLPCFYFS